MIKMKTFSLFSKTQSAEKSSDLLNGNAGPAAGWQPLTQPEDKGEQFFIRVSGFLIRVSVLLFRIILFKIFLFRVLLFRVMQYPVNTVNFIW